MSALFGPGGNSLDFYAAGHKHTMEAPAWVRSVGLDAYEFQGGNGIRGSLESFEKIGEAARHSGVALSVHAPYYISLSGTEPEKRLGSLKYIRQSVDAAHAMGAGIIVIHTGSAAKLTRREAMLLAADTLTQALSEIDTPVRFGLETMGKANQLGTLEEVLELCAFDRRLCPVVDFGHMNALAGGGLFKTADDYLRVFDSVDRALGAAEAERLHCHFSKIEYTASGEKKHLTFEDEVFGPPFEPLVSAIASGGLSPTVICESDGVMAQDALKMKELYSRFLSEKE